MADSDVVCQFLSRVLAYNTLILPRLNSGQMRLRLASEGGFCIASAARRRDPSESQIEIISFALGFRVREKSRQGFSTTIHEKFSARLNFKLRHYHPQTTWWQTALHLVISIILFVPAIFVFGALTWLYQFLFLSPAGTVPNGGALIARGI